MKSFDTGSIKIDFKYVLLLFSIYVVFNMLAIIPPEIYGDGFEYIYMTQAFENHFTPDVREKDILDAQLMLKKSNINNFPDPYLGFYKSFSGKMFSYHFWLYSLITVPVKIILEIFNLNEFKAFQVTNSVLYIFALWSIYLFMNIDGQKKILMVTLLAINPIIWYIRWTHPEVFSYSLTIISLVYFTNKNFKLAVLFSALASTQNPPLIILTSIFYLKYFAEEKKINIKDFIIMLLYGFPAIIPVIFYLYNYGTPNLIVKIGAAGLKFISLQRIYDLIFDLNMGMIIYIPIIVILFFLTTFICIVQKDKRKFFNYVWPVSILIMIILSAQTSNWNHGCSGIMRYSLWMIPVMLYFIFEVIDIRKIFYKQLLVVSIILQMIIVLYGGEFIPRISHLKFNPFAEFILDNLPYLYSPDFETFAERTLNQETSYLDKLPIVYSHNGNVTKVLTDFYNYKKLEEIYDITDYDYYNSQLKKLEKNKNKIMYINFPKGTVKDIESKPMADDGFKADLKLMNSVESIRKNTSFKLKVQISNTSKRIWPAKPSEEGYYQVCLSYHWLDNNGNIIIWDGARTNLPYNLKPKNTPLNIEMTVIAPNIDGNFILEIDLVQEKVAWFKDKGNKTIRIPVKVI